MPKKKPDEFDLYAEEYGEEELDELMELMDLFPDLDEYLDDVLSLDDNDFYEGGK